jgi:hypothetical protein
MKKSTKAGNGVQSSGTTRFWMPEEKIERPTTRALFQNKLLSIVHYDYYDTGNIN